MRYEDYNKLSNEMIFDIKIQHPFLEKFKINRADKKILNPISYTAMQMVYDEFKEKTDYGNLKNEILEYEKKLTWEIAVMITTGIIDLAEIPAIKNGENI